MEVMGMVQPLLPVQVNGSVLENCCPEERTGKSETAKICQQLCVWRQLCMPHRCSRGVSRADAGGGGGRRRRGRLTLPLLFQELLHSGQSATRLLFWC